MAGKIQATVVVEFRGKKHIGTGVGDDPETAMMAAKKRISSDLADIQRQIEERDQAEAACEHWELGTAGCQRARKSFHALMPA